MPMPSRVICILGMHRSGTSCLTGSLQSAGVSLGDCHTWNPYNRRGNRENQGFVDLNDAVLASNGGSWDNPPDAVRWSEEQLNTARKLLSAESGSTVFAFKDPRTLLVLEGWKQVYPGIEFVGIFRHPNAVAASLGHRSGLDRDHSMNLWRKYNRLLLAQYKQRPFPILCFDEPEETFHGKLALALSRLQLDALPGDDRFWEESLRTSNRAEQKRLPVRVALLYRKLLSICL